MNYERRKTLLARWLFAGVVAFLPLQYYVEHKIGEPYPSLIMPSFAGDNTKNGSIQVQSADVQVAFCNGEERTLTPQQFLSNLPGSHVMPAMNWMFGPHTPNSYPISRRKKWIFRYLSPGYGKRVARAEGKSFVDDATRLWISDEMAAKFGGRPKALAVSWYTDSYNLSGAHPERSRRLISVVPVALDRCGQ